MAIGQHETFVRIVGEPYLSRAKAYKAAQTAAEEAWSKFSVDRNASHYSGHRTLESLTFVNPKTRPAGWGQPSRRGRSFPNQTSTAGRAELELIRALPQKPTPWDVFPESEIPYQLNHRGPGKGDSGGGCFTNRPEPNVLWVGDDFYGLIGDVYSAAKEMKEKDPEVTIEDGAETWAIPAGLTRISEARFDLAVATYKVAQEEKKAAAP